MKNKYLDYIEGIFYINLDSRVDRRENFLYESTKVGLPYYERFSAITPTNDELKGPFEIDEWRRFRVGCSLSHLEVVKIAKERGYKNCLIFEDDVVFTRDYKKYIQTYIDELKEIEWDVFYLGGEPNT
jgi:glycosyl transferase family 25